MMLGDYVGDGSIGHFADMMNQRAAELGCTGTSFADPAGFRDMAIIFRRVMENDHLRKILQTRSFDIGPTNRHDSLNQFNYTNALMSSASEYYYAPTDGGFISAAAGESPGIAVMASTGGYGYLLVLLETPAGGDTAGTRQNVYQEA